MKLICEAFDCTNLDIIHLGNGGRTDVSQDEENSMCSEGHCKVEYTLNLTNEYNGSSFSCRAQKQLLPAVESDPSLVLLQGIFLFIILNYIA